MSKKVVLRTRKMGNIKYGGNIMDTVVDRIAPETKEKASACRPDDSRCEMVSLRAYNAEIIKNNGFSSAEVKSIVDEVCGRSVKSRSRY